MAAVTPGLIRTVVPTTVGAIVTFLATYGINVDGTFETALSIVLTGLFGGIYWFAVNQLQSRWPLMGLLLGSTAQPTYDGRHRKTISRSATATPDAPEDRL